MKEKEVDFSCGGKGKELSLGIQQLSGSALQSQSGANEAIYMKPMMEHDI